jgi:competence protein ComEA
MKSEIIWEFLQKYKYWLVGLWVIVLITGIGILVWQGGFWEKTEVRIISNKQDEVKGVKIAVKVWVDVSGEVSSPGVYELEEGDRVAMAIQKAGGITNEADADWVERNLNMAAKIVDGQKIYVPKRVEEIRVVEDSGSRSKKISVNNASQAELESLVGVGPATAKKIISARPFSNLEELVAKKIISAKVLEEIRVYIELW